MRHHDLPPKNRNGIETVEEKSTLAPQPFPAQDEKAGPGVRTGPLRTFRTHALMRRFFPWFLPLLLLSTSLPAMWLFSRSAKDSMGQQVGEGDGPVSFRARTPMLLRPALPPRNRANHVLEPELTPLLAFLEDTRPEQPVRGMRAPTQPAVRITVTPEVQMQHGLVFASPSATTIPPDESRKEAQSADETRQDPWLATSPEPSLVLSPKGFLPVASLQSLPSSVAAPSQRRSTAPAKAAPHRMSTVQGATKKIKKPVAKSRQRDVDLTSGRQQSRQKPVKPPAESSAGMAQPVRQALPDTLGGLY